MPSGSDFNWRQKVHRTTTKKGTQTRHTGTPSRRHTQTKHTHKQNTYTCAHSHAHRLTTAVVHIHCPGMSRSHTPAPAPLPPAPHPHLRNAFQAPISERDQLYRGSVRVRVVQASPRSAPAPAAPAPPAPGHPAAAANVGRETPDVDVLDAAAAKEAVLLPPLRAVGPGADDRGGAEALELPVRVRVGADAPVEVEAARGQACLLFCCCFG